jgi:NADPH:quinone reductase-like Zn-dependent oxidoreductase
VALVHSLGAEHVIDYTEQDFTVGAARYELALQLGGTYSPAAVRKALTPAGRSSSPPATAAAGSARWANIIKAVALNQLVGQSLKSFTAKVTARALIEIGDLIESGYVTPVLGGAYPLRSGRRGGARREEKPCGQGHRRG